MSIHVDRKETTRRIELLTNFLKLWSLLEVKQIRKRGTTSSNEEVHRYLPKVENTFVR